MKLIDPHADQPHEVAEDRGTHRHVMLGHAADEREERAEERHAQRHMPHHDALQRVRCRARDAVVGVREGAHKEATAAPVDDDLRGDGGRVEQRQHADGVPVNEREGVAWVSCECDKKRRHGMFMFMFM